MKWKAAIVLGMLLLIPFSAWAQGFVPCGDTVNNQCQFCHLAQLLNNVMNWLVGILFIVFSIVIVASGVQLVTSAGNTQAKEGAKRKIMNALIGFLIVLAAWLLIDFAMRQLLSTSGPTVLGPWNAIQCVTQPNAPFSPYSAAGSAVSTATGAPISCQIGVDASGNPIYDCTGVCPNGTTAVPNAAGTAVTCTVPNSGGGSCTDGTGTACDPANLGCFNNPAAASQVCMLESGGGNTSAMSGSDLCQDGRPFSVGLWQINLLVNSHLIPGCAPAASMFSSPSCSMPCQGTCARRVTNSNGQPYCAMWDCTVTNTGAYNTCVAAAQNGTNNNAAACSLYNSQGGSAWAHSVRVCGVQP